ncbi:MAG: ArnT family glycosyltransferase [Legionellales bacterium]
MMLDIKNEEQCKQKLFINAFFVLIFLLLCRMIAMCFIPIYDSSEARYAEIARQMLVTGDWVTLQLDHGLPFWAKPPLSTWLSAFTMKCFGVNAFAVRLPGLLLSIGVLWLVWQFAKKHSGSVVATVTIVVLAGTLFFFLDAGTVMTDPSLVFCTTLSMVSFWHALVDKQKAWSYVFFISLGLGLLAKGPVATVLVGLPIFFWVLLRNEWVNLWQRLPWIKGSLITAVIALPWYALAEMRTPGFFSYFIVGEHFNRFLHSGWAGDKYGRAHDEPWGMIWIYALLGMYPWNFLGGFWLVKYWKKVPALFRDSDGWMSYLFVFAVVPLCFFTFASNIIYTYVFPSVPACALFFTQAWGRSKQPLKSVRLIFLWSLIVGVVFLLITIGLKIKPELVSKTHKYIVAAWMQQHPAHGSPLLYWATALDYSAQFYSEGRAIMTMDENVLCKAFSTHLKNYLVAEPQHMEQISTAIRSRCKPIYKGTYMDKTRMLYQCLPCIPRAV